MPQGEDTLVTPPQPARRIRPRLSRRWLIALGVGAALVAVVAAVVASGVLKSGGGTSGGGVVDNAYPTALQTARRKSLSEQTQVSATLGYANPETVVVPAGTAPTDLAQAQQTATTAQGQLATAQAALTADTATLDQAQASLSADRAKLTVDCGGDNAGESPASGSGASANGSGSASGSCATDAQAVTTDEQSLTQDEAKVTTDRQSVSSAATGLASAKSGLAQAESSETVYGQSSTYTELPAIGQIVRRGQTLYEISGEPVVLLYGEEAPWRAFRAGMTPGKDVAELNANLRALGYDAPSGEAFTAGTASAIDAFQAARGLDRSGELLLGSVVFEPGPTRVTTVTPTVGATVQAGPVLTTTSLTRQVTIELDAAEQSDVKVGDPVTITLPDNSTTPGKVSYVGTVATVPSSSDENNGGSSTPTIEVNVTPTDPAATGRLDQAPVNVSITTGSVKNAIVVPVDALLALGTGGYAVEVVGAGGVHHLVSVQLGLFDDADGYVQVTNTSLTPGTRVVVPNE